MRNADASQAFPKVDSSWKVGIVAASFYKKETDALIASAKECLLEAGIPASNISVHPAAGSFEIPLVGEWLASAKKVDALIGLGIIVQGETRHADRLAQESARGLMDVQLKHGIPFAFEILWVDDLAYAAARGDKGREAAMAVLHSLAEKARISA